MLDTLPQEPLPLAEAVAELVRLDIRDPRMRVLALETLKPFGPPRDAAGRWFPPAALGWLRSLAFAREPYSGAGEAALAPQTLVLTEAGDCDDMARAVAAFAGSLGVPWGVVVLQAGTRAHVCAAVGPSWEADGVSTAVDQHFGLMALGAVAENAAMWGASCHIIT